MSNPQAIIGTCGEYRYERKYCYSVMNLVQLKTWPESPEICSQVTLWYIIVRGNAKQSHILFKTSVG